MIRSIDRAAVAELTRQLLIHLGQEPDREGLRDTPRRVADAWVEFLEYDPGSLDTTFEAVAVDQLVVIRGIPLVSMCEHHLMPFRCQVAIGYLTGDRVLGLSKLGRIATLHAHKLQLQERLVRDIADDVSERAGTEHVAVLARGEHLCMSARGVRLPHEMISSEMRGAFRKDAALRAEFLGLASGSA
ncbi:MAG: cyclohydrolase FolE [Arthrobacter sp.]|jgi:GTP cyclohydrolase I|nr:cyclohydrolase FolE [Arthrobacter sp.]